MPMHLTAEDLYQEMKRMPANERLRFFSLLTNEAFGETDFTHEQVFGRVHREPFSALEAAEYLEVSIPTFRRYVQADKIKPVQVIGRSQLFDAADLRAFKRSLGR